jgi:hypothetical protein
MKEKHPARGHEKKKERTKVQTKERTESAKCTMGSLKYETYDVIQRNFSHTKGGGLTRQLMVQRYTP